MLGTFALALGVIAPAAASAAPTPSIDIHSAGPLSDIYIGNDLSCQVRSGGFGSTEYFPNASGPGDCGTFLFLNSDTIPETLFGPDFANHAGGTHAGGFPIPEQPFTASAGNQSFSGTGTTSDPYQVTTVVTGTVQNQSGGTVALRVTEVDTYVVGQNFYSSAVTIKNIGGPSGASLDQGGELYRAADCQLRGTNSGRGVAEPSGSPVTGACAVTPSNSPPSALEELLPVTTTNYSWAEASSATIWGELGRAGLPDSVLTGSADNGQALEWSVPALAPGESSPTFSFETMVLDTAPTGGFSLSATAGTPVNATLATIADPNTSATAGAYSATINWGDSSSSAGAVTGSGGSFTVQGSHTYAAAGTYPVTVTITATQTALGSSSVTDSATVMAPPPTGGGGGGGGGVGGGGGQTAAPVVSGGSPSTTTGHGASVSGIVTPDNLPTTAFFQYGLDPSERGPGAPSTLYDQSTPPQPVGSDATSHSVSATLTGLIPDALYHVRLVASNSAGTTFGPDQTFTTAPAPAPPPPVLGHSEDAKPVSGRVFVRLDGQFVPLTGAVRLPSGTVIDALHGSLKLIAAIGKGKTQHGTFGGAVFRMTQSRSGVTTLSLLNNAFPGAPSFATCPAHKTPDASAAALSSRTLQLLRASAHGRFRTSGRYSAATVRGTKWTVADRCDGTLTHDITDSVVVNDFVHHKTIILHAGQSYLALAPRGHKH